MKARSRRTWTYGELPRSPVYGVFMTCGRGCEGRFSACRGDYFMRAPDALVKCGECGGAMVLAREATRLVEVLPGEAETPGGAS